MWPGLARPLETVSYVADLTAPGVSLIFVALFVVATYFHDQHFTPTTIAIGGWIALQVTGWIIREDLHSSSEWLWSLAGKVLFYAIIGFGWAIAKLCFEVWQGRYSEPLLVCANTTLAGSLDRTECFATFFVSCKWQLTQWTATWPISVVHTLAHDPLRIAVDVAVTSSKYRVAWLVETVFVGSTASADAIPISYVVGGIFLYLLIGYAWTHAKLFIDVLQGSLPTRLDAELQELHAKKQTYWTFLRKIKWIVAAWMIGWPLSMLYTITQHPVRLLVDLVYRLSQKKYNWIIGYAMEKRTAKVE